MKKNTVLKALLCGFPIMGLLTACASGGNSVNEISEPVASGGCC